MRRMITFVLALLSFVTVIAPSANCYGGWSAHVIWQAAKIGKLAAEPQFGPNNLLYALSENKLSVLDENGCKLWETGGLDSSKSGCLVFDSHGSIFIAGKSLIQEVKLNGSSGWSFKVCQNNSKSSTQLTTGPGNLLYLHLPSALYAVDSAGNYKWMVIQWGNRSADSNQLDADLEILASAGNNEAVFVVLGKKKEGYSLIALSGEGKILWSCWLGDIKGANLATGRDGLLYATVNPGKMDRMNRGMVYAFDCQAGGTPIWSHGVDFDDLTAPALSESNLIYFCAGERLYAVNQTNGTEAWCLPLLKVISRPSVDTNNGRVYLGTEDKRLLAVNSEGHLDWELTLDGKVSIRPLVGPGGYLYVATDAGSIYKIKDEAPAPDGGQ